MVINKVIKSGKAILLRITSGTWASGGAYKRPVVVNGMLLVAILCILSFIVNILSHTGNTPESSPLNNKKEAGPTDEKADIMEGHSGVPALFRVLVGYHCIPKIANTLAGHRQVDCGEDAFKVEQSPDNSSWLIAVADGVGGWATRGVDSSVYSWLLVSCLASDFLSSDQNRNLTPKKLLSNCVTFVQESCRTQALSSQTSDSKFGGSSTAVVLRINCKKPNYCDLFAANLGDSGFVLYKLKIDGDPQWTEVMRSTEQQHSFNFPFQVAADPSQGDSPANADEYGITLQKNTTYLALVASDGLFDNLFPYEILETLNKHTRDITTETLDLLSKELAERSISVGNNLTVCGPFCTNARTHGYELLGGYAYEIGFNIIENSMTPQ